MIAHLNGDRTLFQEGLDRKDIVLRSDGLYYDREVPKQQTIHNLTRCH